MSEVNENQESDYIKMDYTLETPEEAVEKVKEIIASTPEEKLTPSYLERLGQYIIDIDIKNKKRNKIKDKDVIATNSMITIHKRETSFEGLISKLENGEDGIYNMIRNDKNIIFQPKVSITDEDVEKVPGLKELKEEIDKVEQQMKSATGKKKFLLKKQLIEMHQDQYVLKSMVHKPISCSNLIKSMPRLNLDEEVGLDENGNIFSTGIINIYNPEHISAVLCNYSKIKEDCYDRLNSDVKYFIMDLENTIDKALENYPILKTILIYKIDKLPNLEIQQIIKDEYGVLYSVEHISSLWRKKIPALIVEQATDDWLDWNYTYQEKGYWKKCSCCGQMKLGIPRYFSKNNTSKDGLYSICKECRSRKYKEKNN